MLSAKLKRMLDPTYRLLRDGALQWRQSWRGVTSLPPGHFRSPLLDLKVCRRDKSAMSFDGPSCGSTSIFVRTSNGRITNGCSTTAPCCRFRKSSLPGFDTSQAIPTLCSSDAITLSTILQKEKPKQDRRSGFRVLVGGDARYSRPHRSTSGTDIHRAEPGAAAVAVINPKTKAV